MLLMAKGLQQPQPLTPSYRFKTEQQPQLECDEHENMSTLQQCGEIAAKLE